MLTRRTPLRATGRDTGPNGATRVAVLMRDEDRCVRCGEWPLWPYDFHHRKRRSQGGTNKLSNLILLCRGCHDWVHTHPQASFGTGWLVRRNVDPLGVPVWYRGMDPVLLDNNGGKREAE